MLRGEGGEGGRPPVSAGVSGCPGWSPAPDGRPPPLCSSAEPAASSPPPLTADQSPGSARSSRSPAGGGTLKMSGHQSYPTFGSKWQYGLVQYPIVLKVILGQICDNIILAHSAAEKFRPTRSILQSNQNPCLVKRPLQNKISMIVFYINCR